MKPRSLVSISLILLLIGIVSSPAIAAPIVVLNGQHLSFDVFPIIEDGRTLVPLGKIFSALGADVKWDGATQTITATKGGTEIKLTIGQTYAFKNGTIITLDVPAKVVDGRTMVPLGFITESFGIKLTWLDPFILLTSDSNTPIKTTFRNTKWGMTKAEVFASENSQYRENDHALIFEGPQFNGCNSDLMYYFLDSSLSLGLYDINTKGAQSSDLLNIYLDLYDQLTAEYGPALIQQNTRASDLRNLISNPNAFSANDEGCIWANRYSIVLLVFSKNETHLSVQYYDLTKWEKTFKSLGIKVPRG